MRPLLSMLAQAVGVSDQELLEKDVRLHLLLGALAGDVSVGPHLVFKGGTCLIKCYLDYPRFSTDLDFTWRWASHRARCSSRGTKALRRSLRPVQREVVSRLTALASADELGFSPRRDVTYGRSNRMMTIGLRYDGVSGLPGLLKVQVNFDEVMLYPTRRVEARSLLRGPLPPTIRLLDSDRATRYGEPVPIEAYDPREILAEKGRAILTRSAAKSRDMVDLYLLESRMGLRVQDHEEDILKKTRHALVGAERYRRELARVDDRLGRLREDDVAPLLLKPFDAGAFDRFRERTIPLLTAVAQKLRREA